MDTPLRAAVALFAISLIGTVTSGLWMIWGPDLMTEVPVRVFVTSLLLLLGSGSYIAVRDALQRMSSGGR